MSGKRSFGRRGVLGVMALLPAAWVSGSAAQDAGGTPQERLAIEPLAIRTKAGTVHFLVEMARSPAEQSKGLMFRVDVPDGTGMLFVHEPPRPVAMWMKNTPTSLDMLFIDATGLIRKIDARTTPYSEAVLASGGPVAGVLEIHGGEAERLGIAVGDVVHHPHFGR
jgi:uncharacterized membrane protein (UPF0127 family)